MSAAADDARGQILRDLDAFEKTIKADAKATDDADDAALEAAAAKATSDLTALGVEYDRLRAEFAAYKTAHPDTPAPPPVVPPVVPPKPPVQLFAIGGAYLSNTDPKPLETRVGVAFETSRTYWSATQVASAVARVKADIAAGRKVSHISFKFPASWAQMSTGSGDAWAKDIAAKLSAAIAGTSHLVRIAMHHEPENDTGANAGNTAAGRDAWKATQARLAPFFDKPGIEYVIVLMGYHSLSTTSSLYPLWKLDAAIPNSPAIKGIGYDLYETYGSEGSTKWKDWDSYIAKIKAFHGPRNLKWGLSEVGVTDAAIAAKPTWFTETIGKIKAGGGSWFDYFNTNLNSVSPWYMDSGSVREKAFVKALRDF